MDRDLHILRWLDLNSLGFDDQIMVKYIIMLLNLSI